MKDTRRFLLDALGWGAFLVTAVGGGCAGRAGDDDPRQPVATSDAPSPAPVTPTQTYAESDLSCTGERHPDDQPGYHGRCCTQVHCFTPDAGGCPVPEAIDARIVPGFPTGSGLCSCGETTGPFNLNPDVRMTAWDEPVATPQAGRCCYLKPRISCDGRPFACGEGRIVADVHARADWSRPWA